MPALMAFVSGKNVKPGNAPLSGYRVRLMLLQRWEDNKGNLLHKHNWSPPRGHSPFYRCPINLSYCAPIKSSVVKSSQQFCFNISGRVVIRPTDPGNLRFGVPQSISEEERPQPTGIIKENSKKG